MKKRLTLVFVLVFVICCALALSVNAAECDVHTDSWTVNTANAGGYGYLGEIEATNTCSVCGSVISTETIQPMFETVGYSYCDFEGGAGGISQKFAVNREAVARFSAITGKTVKFGAVAAVKEALGGGNHAVNSNGEAINGNVLTADMTDKPFDIFDIMVNGIPSDYLDSAAIICSAYIIIDGVVTYIENGTISDVAVAHTYNQVVKIVNNIEDEEEPVEKNSLKILTIGNSFSDDAMEYVYYIAKAAGYESVELGNLRRDGCSLETHVSSFNSSSGYIFRHWVDGATAWNHVWNVNNAQCAASPKDVFEMGIEWDFVVFQQVSTSTDYSALADLIELVKPYCPNAKFAWHMTWATKSDNGSGYNNIVNAVKTQILPMEDIDIIIPTGAAIQNAKASSLSNDLLYRDGKHLSYGMGRYIASMTLFKTLTGRSIDDITPPVKDTEGHSATSGSTSHRPPFNITESMNELCIAAANGAVTNPPVQVAAARGKEE